MKSPLHSITAAALFTAISASANAQTLGAAADYDIFVTNGGSLQLKDSNQLYGQVAFSNGSSGSGTNMQNFEGAVHSHSGSDFDSGSGFNPSGGYYMSSAIDSSIDQANADLSDYTSYLDSLTADYSYTSKQVTAFTLTTNKAMTVVDFTELDMADSDFTLIGNNASDQIIIRISRQLAFDGVNVNLTNLDQRNVIWYYTDNGNFDLHRGTPVNEFAGTIIAPVGKVIVGEANFTGAVYGSELVLGSGFTMEGNTVPEPSSCLMLLSGIGTLLLIRRRNH